MTLRVIAPAALVIAAFACGCATGPDPARTTPKSTARTLITALAEGNKSVVHKCVVDTAEQRKVADGIMALSHGMHSATNAMQKRWGENVERALGSPLDIARISSSMIDSGEEAITGDTATLATKMLNLSMIHKTDGWRVDLIQSMRLDKQMITYAVPIFSAMGNACGEVAGEIDAGKYTTSSDAMNAIQARTADALFAETRKIAMKELKSRLLSWP
jgi:hypothetical protein